MYLLVRGPEGRPVVIEWRAWDHVSRQHPEIADSLMDVVLTIESPMHREPDPTAGRERLFRRGGPDGWLRAIIEFDGDFDRLVTAFFQSNDPRRGRRQ